MYLVNGFQLKGEVIEYDAEAVLFKHKEVHQLINRSAITTMYPVSASKGPPAEWWKGLRPKKVTGSPVSGGRYGEGVHTHYQA